MIANAYDFVLKWRYLGLFSASMIESEPVLICISFLSCFLKFSFLLIFLLSVMGTFIRTTVFFILGRRFRFYFESFSFIKKNMPKIDNLIKKYGIYFIISFRFIYGIKLISPIILGFSTISFRSFVIANFIGSIFWSCTMICSGVILSFFLKTFNIKVVLYVYILTIIIPFILALLFTFLRKLLFKKKD